MTWLCARCTKSQTTPKSHQSVKYCDPCRPLAKVEQTRAWQQAHLSDHHSWRKKGAAHADP